MGCCDGVPRDTQSKETWLDGQRFPVELEPLINKLFFFSASIAHAIFGTYLHKKVSVVCLQFKCDRLSVFHPAI